jgi:DNA-binding CsgD family transcriptional regulator
VKDSLGLGARCLVALRPTRTRDPPQTHDYWRCAGCSLSGCVALRACACLSANRRQTIAGDALLAPAITRRIIEQFAARPIKPQLDARLQSLTQHEREVLVLLARGNSNAELAATLFVSEGTIKTHVSSLLTKLELRESRASRRPGLRKRTPRSWDIDVPLSFGGRAGTEDLHFVRSQTGLAADDTGRRPSQTDPSASLT